jgi:hypothetical protein
VRVVADLAIDEEQSGIIRPIQSGDVNFYLLYVFAAVLIACLIAAL